MLEDLKTLEKMLEEDVPTLALYEELWTFVCYLNTRLMNELQSVIGVASSCAEMLDSKEDILFLEQMHDWPTAADNKRAEVLKKQLASGKFGLGCQILADLKNNFLHVFSGNDFSVEDLLQLIDFCDTGITQMEAATSVSSPEWDSLCGTLVQNQEKLNKNIKIKAKNVYFPAIQHFQENMHGGVLEFIQKFLKKIRKNAVEGVVRGLDKLARDQGINITPPINNVETLFDIVGQNKALMCKMERARQSIPSREFIDSINKVAGYFFVAEHNTHLLDQWLRSQKGDAVRVFYSNQLLDNFTVFNGGFCYSNFMHWAKDELESNTDVETLKKEALDISKPLRTYDELHKKTHINNQFFIVQSNLKMTESLLGLTIDALEPSYALGNGQESCSALLSGIHTEIVRWHKDRLTEKTIGFELRLEKVNESGHALGFVCCRTAGDGYYIKFRDSNIGKLAFFSPQSFYNVLSSILLGFYPKFDTCRVSLVSLKKPVYKDVISDYFELFKSKDIFKEKNILEQVVVSAEKEQADLVLRNKMTVNIQQIENDIDTPTALDTISLINQLNNISSSDRAFMACLLAHIISDMQDNELYDKADRYSNDLKNCILQLEQDDGFDKNLLNVLNVVYYDGRVEGKDLEKLSEQELKLAQPNFEQALNLLSVNYVQKIREENKDEMDEVLKKEREEILERFDDLKQVYEKNPRLTADLYLQFSALVAEVAGDFARPMTEFMGKYMQEMKSKYAVHNKVSLSFL